MPAAEFKERVPLIFKLNATGPTASGRQPATRTVTKECVQRTWWAVNELCDDSLRTVDLFVIFLFECATWRYSERAIPSWRRITRPPRSERGAMGPRGGARV